MAMLNIRYEGTILPSSGACLAVALLLCKGWPEEGDIVDTTLQAIFTWVSYQLYFHPLARIPGPPHWILSRVPFVWALRRGEFAARITEIHERYGPVVRIASNEVSFIDEKAWSAFYAYRQGSSLPKSPFWYRPRVNNGTYGIMGSPNADHGRFRRALAPAFTEKAMREHEPMIQHHVNLLLSKFRNEAAKETPFDVVDWFEYAAFDIVGDLSFSKSFRTLENSEYHYLVNALRKFMNAFTQAVIPRILGLEMIWQFIVPKLSRQKQMAYNKSLNYWTHQRATQTEIPNKTDLMAYFLNRTNDKGLSIVETENAIGDLMVAGSETVASTLTAICYHLVWNSEARHTVTTEIRLAFGEERDITTERVANLPYLNAVINEAMRLCPSLPMVMPRIVTAPGMEVCGFWLPTGVCIPHSL